MAQRWREVEPDVLRVGPAGARAQSGLASQPVVEVATDRLSARVDVRALLDPVEQVDQGGLGAPSSRQSPGSSAADSRAKKSALGPAVKLPIVLPRKTTRRLPGAARQFEVVSEVGDLRFHRHGGVVGGDAGSGLHQHPRH